MNHRVEVRFDDFVVSEAEQIVFEKALYTLLDKFKQDRLDTYCANMPFDFPKQINACFAKLTQHDNYRKNPRFFSIDVPEIEYDAEYELLGLRSGEAVAS